MFQWKQSRILNQPRRFTLIKSVFIIEDQDAPKLIYQNKKLNAQLKKKTIWNYDKMRWHGTKHDKSVMSDDEDALTRLALMEQHTA